MFDFLLFQSFFIVHKFRLPQEMFRLYDPIGGEHMNIMKAAFVQAHRIVAVSHGFLTLS